MKKKVDEIRIPADRRPETIADVFSIVITELKKGTGHVETRIVHLEGTVEEKLRQYKDATGKDWNGFDERVFGVYEDAPLQSLDLGKKPERLIAHEDREIQEKIDALTEEAGRYLKENELAKTRTKLVSTLAARPDTTFVQE